MLRDDRHVVHHGLRIRVDLHDRDLVRLGVGVRLERQQPRLVRLDDGVAEVHEVLLERLELSGLHRVRPDEDEWCGHDLLLRAPRIPTVGAGTFRLAPDGCASRRQIGPNRGGRMGISTDGPDSFRRTRQSVLVGRMMGFGGPDGRGGSTRSRPAGCTMRSGGTKRATPSSPSTRSSRSASGISSCSPSPRRSWDAVSSPSRPCSAPTRPGSAPAMSIVPSPSASGCGRPSSSTGSSRGPADGHRSCARSSPAAPTGATPNRPRPTRRAGTRDGCSSPRPMR